MHHLNGRWQWLLAIRPIDSLTLKATPDFELIKKILYYYYSFRVKDSLYRILFICSCINDNNQVNLLISKIHFI